MAAIRIDTSQLTHRLFQIPGVITEWVDGSSPAQVRLPPGRHRFQQASGYTCDFTFEVTEDGKVHYASRFAAFLGGDGTDTLVIRGFPVRFDATALSHDLLPLIAGADFLPRDRAHDLVLVPASHYGLIATSGVVADFEFKVELDGAVSINPRYTGFASGIGKTLTIRGYIATIDARALSHDLSMLISPSMYLPRSRVNQVVVLPTLQDYGFVSASGVPADFGFRLSPSGDIHINDRYTSFASASGAVLTIRGCQIKVDGRGLSHDLLPMLLGWAGGFLPRQVVNELTLIPAKMYGFQPGSGSVAHFSFAVGADGKISYPVDCVFLSGQGTDTLVVDGYPILIDTRHADSNLLSIVNIPIPADTPRLLFAVLVPARFYQPMTRHGVFKHAFDIKRDGSVTFDPAVAGSYVVSTVTRLEIRGRTPF